MDNYDYNRGSANANNAYSNLHRAPNPGFQRGYPQQQQQHQHQHQHQQYALPNSVHHVQSETTRGIGGLANTNGTAYDHTRKAAPRPPLVSYHTTPPPPLPSALTSRHRRGRSASPTPKEARINFDLLDYPTKQQQQQPPCLPSSLVSPSQQQFQQHYTRHQLNSNNTHQQRGRQRSFSGASLPLDRISSWQSQASSVYHPQSTSPPPRGGATTQGGRAVRPGGYPVPFAAATEVQVPRIEAQTFSFPLSQSENQLHKLNLHHFNSPVSDTISSSPSPSSSLSSFHFSSNRKNYPSGGSNFYDTIDDNIPSSAYLANLYRNPMNSNSNTNTQLSNGGGSGVDGEKDAGSLSPQLSSPTAATNYNNNNDRKSSPPRMRLTEQEKKNNHIASEQKRRNAIREGFDRLTMLIPGLEGQGRSEGLVLGRSIDFINDQLEERRILIEKIERLGGVVPSELRKLG